MDTNRVSRIKWFLQLAAIVADRSTCNRGNVGAVIVRNGRVISIGYNGAPAGLPHCTDVGCEELTVKEVGPELHGDFDDHDEYIELGCQRAIHAEANAIAYAARAGISTEGATMYCTHSPCRKCTELMGSAGIKSLFYIRVYRLTPWALLESMGITPHQGEV